jgi:four helix bundle protein
MLPRGRHAGLPWLQVWQKAHRLTLDMYRVTRSFPAEERYGLTSQLRRSAASVPTNVAEGCGRDGERDLARFISIAAGSASETEYHLMLARDLEYLPEGDYDRLFALVTDIKKMLRALHRKLTTDSSRGILRSADRSG